MSSKFCTPDFGGIFFENWSKIGGLKGLTSGYKWCIIKLVERSSTNRKELEMSKNLTGYLKQVLKYDVGVDLVDFTIISSRRTGKLVRGIFCFSGRAYSY
jgi:hypothetical protein